MQVSSDQPHLIDYLLVLKKRKWLFLAYLFATVVSVVVSDHYAKPIYMATAKMVISKDASRSILSGKGSDISGVSVDGMFLRSHYEMMTSRPVLVKVVKALGLDQPRESEEKSEEQSTPTKIGSFLAFFKKDKSEEEKTPLSHDDILIQKAHWLKNKITIRPVEATRLVNVEVEHTDPVMARDIANTLAGTYIEHDFESNMNATKKMFSLLSDQLLKIKKDIGESEESISAFKEKENIFSPEDRQRTQTKELDGLNAIYLKTKTDKIGLSARIEELERITSKGDYGGSVPSIAESRIIENLYRDLIKGQIELSELEEVSGARHPLLEPGGIAQIKSRIRLIKKELNNELKRVVEKLEGEYAILENREETLGVSIRQLEREVLESNKVESRFVPLRQEAKANRELYNLLLDKLKQADILEGMRQAGIRIAEPALLPRFPIKPRKALNTVVGIIVGLMLGVGSVFFVEYLDRTIKGPTEVKQQLGLPLLCTIPKV